MKKVDLDKAKVILRTLLIAIVVLIIIIAKITENLPTIILAAIILSSVWGITYRTIWRCPYCGKVLGNNGNGGTHCSHCGEDLHVTISI